MAGSFTYTNILANLAAGNQPLSKIDQDFTDVAAQVLSLNSYGNFYVDTGSANAYAITVSAPQTVAIAAGLPFQVKVIHANTGASTLTINGGTPQNILTPSVTALTGGQIPLNSILNVMHDGTQFLMLGFAIGTELSNSISGNVNLSNTGNYFDGPVVAQGTIGKWFFSGQVTLVDTAGAATFNVKLWDGTTVINSARVTSSSTNADIVVPLTGVLTSPAASVKISVNDGTSTSGMIVANASGNAKDSTLFAFRIA